MKHVDIKSSPVRIRRNGASLGRAAVAGGLVAAGAAFGVLLSVPSGDGARAGEHNFVKSSSHEAIASVRLDEEVTIFFSAALQPQSVGPDTILLRTGPTQGEQANGSYVVGRFLTDNAAQRRVITRPEAIQEYYQLIRGLSRENATAQADRLLTRIEKTGNFKELRKIDQALLRSPIFGPAAKPGTRLDDDNVLANYPPILNPGDAQQPYRERIAGDDAKWRDYLVNGNNAAFVELQQNPEYERFYHAVDRATGIAAADSVLRARTYRRVMMNRRSGKTVMFVPEIPIRPDLSDSGYKTSSPYSITVPASQTGVYNTVLTKRGQRPLLQKAGRDYSTYFTTMAGTSASVNLFLDPEARTGLATLQKPRVINVTPPNGETLVDPTTDWEDPDNQALVPVAARKTFTIRMRFANALDPRTVSPTNFTLRQIKQNVGTASEKDVDIPVAIGTFLNQHRLGIVEVEMTPASNIEGGGLFEVAAKGLVKSLGGELLNTDYKVSFATGDLAPPLDAIRENFLTVGNQANPNDPDTSDQFTTAHWPASTVYDPQLTGRGVAKFMPFAGTGVGAPEVPADPQTPIVRDLDVATGELLSFLTEDLDPASPNFGKQIEYHYRSVRIAGGTTVQANGRYPLVIRSQTTVLFDTANVKLNGQPGGIGRMNADPTTGEPTGGLGGAGGAGGFRGGDGGGAPLTNQSNQPVRDEQGRLQFDQAKINGADGGPGYLSGGLPAGGASGGFSGDDETPTIDSNGDGNITPEDIPTTPDRMREAGGGGGHATAGTNGAGAQGSLQTTTDGYPGGMGGAAYGDEAFSTMPLNAFGAPALGAGFGGAGGSGGGLEDDGLNGDPTGDGIVGPEDAGGGGGGGGGGGIQIVARGSITISGSTIDCSGGVGGGTRDPNDQEADLGQGAPGGAGAGGSIVLQAFEGQVDVTSSNLWAFGGDGKKARGFITQGSDGNPLAGEGGTGGDGYVRIEDVDGLVPDQAGNMGGQVRGVLSVDRFAPVGANGTYPGRTDGAIMVVNQSILYSRWFNSLLDTPTFVPVYDVPETPTIEGTSIFDFAAESGGSVLVEVRAAPNDTANTGHPNLFQATSWVPLDNASDISDRRFLQFRITFSLPLTYSFENPLPYVDFLQIGIETQ